MLYTQPQATDFIDRMIKLHRAMKLDAFLDKFRTEYYPNCKFEFMKKFLEWSLIENKNMFIIPHQMLYEYGITKDDQSCRAKERIDTLELVESEDYTLTKFRERNNGRGSNEKHQYDFTPYAFKLMLMSATKHKTHEVDVGIYRKYYLFLEEGVSYYQSYQFEVADRERKFNEQKFRLADSYGKSSLTRLEQQLKTQTSILVELTTINHDQTSMIVDQTDQINKLLGYGKKTKKECKEIKKKCNEISDHVEDLQIDIQTAIAYGELSSSMLEDRSKKSTMNPQQEGRHHYFACTGYKTANGKRVAKFISGQKDYVEQTVAGYTTGDNPHQVLLAPFYNANPIDLRNNSQAEFVRRRTELITRLNSENKAADDAYNAHQNQLVKMFNASISAQISKIRAKIRAEKKKKQSTSLTQLSEYETNIANLQSQKMQSVRRKTPKIKVGDIDIDFKRGQFLYADNPFIKFDEVLKVVTDVNEFTQENPVPITEELEDMKQRDPIDTYSEEVSDDEE